MWRTKLFRFPYILQTISFTFQSIDAYNIFQESLEWRLPFKPEALLKLSMKYFKMNSSSHSYTSKSVFLILSSFPEEPARYCSLLFRPKVWTQGVSTISVATKTQRRIGPSLFRVGSVCLHVLACFHSVTDLCSIFTLPFHLDFSSHSLHMRIFITGYGTHYDDK